MFLPKIVTHLSKSQWYMLRLYLVTLVASNPVNKITNAIDVKHQAMYIFRIITRGLEIGHSTYSLLYLYTYSKKSLKQQFLNQGLMYI